MTKSKAEQALEFAKTEAARADHWIDLHNAVFGIGGKCTELFPTQSDRVAFSKTPDHAAILELLAEVRRERGDQPRELAELTAKANGKLSVRLPSTIHAALLAEAKAEGVSLNQLCLAKLSVQLRALT